MNRLPTARGICTIDMCNIHFCMFEELRVVLIHGSKGFDQEEEDDDGDDDGEDGDGRRGGGYNPHPRIAL